MVGLLLSWEFKRSFAPKMRNFNLSNFLMNSELANEIFGCLISNLHNNKCSQNKIIYFIFLVQNHIIWILEET